jgi:O-antigen/teichoic acid export membrane protein
LSQNNALESISFGASVFLLGKIILNLCTFALNAILSRILGANIYGVYAFSITTINILYIFTNAGGDKSLLKYLPEYENQKPRNKIVTLAFTTSIIICVSIILVLYLFSGYINYLTLGNDIYENILPLIGIYLLFETFLKIMGGVLRGLEMAIREVILNKIIYPVFRLAAVAIGVYLSLDLFSIFWLLVVAGLISVIYGGYQLISLDFRPDFDISKPRAKEYYDFSIPLGFKDIASFLYARFDILMVGVFLSSASVGIYNIAILLSGIITIPLAAFNHLFPSIASGLLHKQKYSELAEIFSTVTRWSFTLSLFAGLYLIIYRIEVLAIFGEEFTGGAIILALLIAGQIMNSVAGPSGYILMMSERQYLIVFNQWAFGLMNIALNYVLILEFRAVGAAVATMTTLTLLNLTRIIEVHYLEGIHPYNFSYIKLFLPTLSMIVVGRIISSYLEGIGALFIGGIVCMVVFFGILIASGLEEEEYQLIRNILDDI